MEVDCSLLRDEPKNFVFTFQEIDEVLGNNITQ